MAKNRRPVVITNSLRGVYFGYTDADGSKDYAEIENLRHVFTWNSFPDARGVTGLATRGPAAGSKIGPAVKFGIIREVSNIYDCEPEAEKNWLESVWVEEEEKK